MSKKKGCLKIFLLLLALLGCAMMAWGLFNFHSPPRDGQPLVEVSPETTVLTTPLDSNGDIDYLEALNQIGSSGITPEKNAMVKFAEALGPIVEGEKLSAEFFQRLQMPRPVDDGDYYVPFLIWLKNSGVVDDDSYLSDTSFTKQYEFAIQNPWSAEQFPELNKWLAEVQKSVDIIREGTVRPSYYHPLISNSGGARLIHVRLHVPQMMRDLARYFSISAMRNLENGDVDASFSDILTMYRLANHVAEGPTLIEELLGLAIFNMANESVAKICRSEKANSRQLNRFFKELEQFSPPHNVTRRIDIGERFMGLDIIQSIGRGKTELNGFTPNSPEQGAISKTGIIASAVDWREAMLVLNHWYDKMVVAVKIEDREKRNAAIESLHLEMIKLEAKTSSPSNLILTVLGGRKLKGRTIGNIWASILMPEMEQVQNAETRGQAKFEMTKILVALSAFKDDKGQWPESLGELVPRYLADIPLDPFSNKAFIYNSEKNEIELYTVGANGIDENGKNDLLKNGPGDDWQINGEIKTWDQYKSEYE